MKIFIPALLFIIFLSTSLLVSAEKYALIIAIGNYPTPEKNGWQKISSANDDTLLEGALKDQGFKKENISTLIDIAATKSGIVKALDGLISKTRSGDIVVIHFSGHGVQLQDDNGDEADGLDEALVPYGAIHSVDRNRFAELSKGYLRDDEFGVKATLLRNKLGGKGDLLVLLDVCYSGTGAPGLGENHFRGGKPPMVGFKFDANKNRREDNGSVFKDKSGPNLEYDASSFILISGAAGEFSFECRDDKGTFYGPLSRSFAMTMANVKDKTSYRTLFTQIENNMRILSPQQQPVLEADGADRLLFGGNYLSGKPYFMVDKWKNEEEFTISGGEISGLLPGSVVSLYPVGTTDPSDILPLNKATITATDNFTAQAKLSAADTLFKASEWAFVSALNYGTGKLKLDVRNMNGTTKKIKESLKDFPLIEFNTNYELYLDTSGSTKTWALKYPSGKIFAGNLLTDGAQNIEEIKNLIKRYSRYRYLLGLNFAEPGLSADVRLVCLNEQMQIDEAKIKSRTTNGRLELKEGDEVYLKITNTGNKKFYINVIDLASDGKLNPILPNKFIANPVAADECIVNKNDTLLLKNFKITIGPSYGDETFKVFLSRDPIDLEDILTKGNNTSSTRGGVLSNLAKVLINSEMKDNGKRGGTGEGVNTDQNGTVFNVNFAVVPK